MLKCIICYIHTHIHVDNYMSTNPTAHQCIPKSYLKANPNPIPEYIQSLVIKRFKDRFRMRLSSCIGNIEFGITSPTLISRENYIISVVPISTWLKTSTTMIEISYRKVITKPLANGAGYWVRSARIAIIQNISYRFQQCFSYKYNETHHGIWSIEKLS